MSIRCWCAIVFGVSLTGCDRNKSPEAGAPDPTAARIVGTWSSTRLVMLTEFDVKTAYRADGTFTAEWRWRAPGVPGVVEPTEERYEARGTWAVQDGLLVTALSSLEPLSDARTAESNLRLTLAAGPQALKIASVSDEFLVTEAGAWRRTERRVR